MEKALVFNDVHIPWHNQRAINLMFKIGKELDPDVIVINGDLVDMWEISKYAKNPAFDQKANLYQEIELGRVFLWNLREQFPKAIIIYIFGNHEYRWYLDIATFNRAKYKLRGMSLEEQLGCDVHDIKVVFSGNKESMWQWGDCLIGHFNRVSKHSAYTAKAIMEDKSVTIIQGHVHRGGVSYKRLWDRDIVGYENFCLCDRNPPYMEKPNWQLGFSALYKDENNHVKVIQHHIEEMRVGKKLIYKCFYNGKVYTN